MLTCGGNARQRSGGAFGCLLPTSFYASFLEFQTMKLSLFMIFCTS